jgi:hypothetical protein
MVTTALALPCDRPEPEVGARRFGRNILPEAWPDVEESDLPRRRKMPPPR